MKKTTALLLGLAAAPVALGAVMAARALRLKPREKTGNMRLPVEVDGDKATENLATLVKYATVSNADFDKTDKPLFARYREKLKELYPTVTANSEYKELGNTAMLFKIAGKSREKPTVLMSHYDVVPVEEDRWAHPPFCGEVIDGELWGRGTLDTKITMVGIMESLEKLLGEGFVPENDIYLAFGGDEEVSGISIPAVVEYMKEAGITPNLVLDEGGAVAEGILPGIDKPVAVIGIGEKGMCEIELVATSDGGHSSTPPQHTSLGKLAQSIVNIENSPFEAQVTRPVEGMLKAVAPYTSLPLKMVLANMWLFKPVLPALAGVMGGQFNAMMRTTVAATMAQGSKQSNVLPNESKARLNVRLLNNTTPRQALERIQDLCEEGVTARFVIEQAASPYAASRGENWDKVALAIEDTWTDAIVSPYLMVGGSDSRHFSRICNDVYKFSRIHVSAESMGLIHNDDERIPVERIAKTVEFFTRLIKTL